MMMEESMNETWKLNKEAKEEMKMTESKFIINNSEEVKKQSIVKYTKKSDLLFKGFFLSVCQILAALSEKHPTFHQPQISVLQEPYSSWQKFLEPFQSKRGHSAAKLSWTKEEKVKHVSTQNS